MAELPPRKPHNASTRAPAETPLGPTLSTLRAAPRFTRPTPEPEPQPQPAACPKCEGRGYELYSAGELSRARACSCQGDCPDCKGRGFQLQSRPDGYTYHAPCTCQGLRRRIERFNQALIPSHYAHKDLRNFERTEGTEHVFEYIRTYARGFPADRNGMVLVGPPGVGKTHLVVGILKALTLEKGIRCLFKDFFLLLSEVREAYDNNRFDTAVLKPLTEVDVLVIDELGKGRSNSEWELGLLDEIICKRYNQMKTTLLTTNFPLEVSRERLEEVQRITSLPRSTVQREGLGNLTSTKLMPPLEERIGDRIFSRLKQMCIFLRVEAMDFRRTHSAGGGGRSRR